MLNESKYHISSEEMLSEQKEIEAAKTDPARFEVLYNKYYEPILQFVYKRVEGKEAAFDITSQVFLNAMLKLSQFKFMGTPFSSWLYRIALNEINMLYRKDKIQRSIKVDESELKSVIHEINPDDDIDAQYQRVTEVLGDFPEEDIQLIELRFFEKRAFKEIGDIMNMTENNAKVKLYRLLDKLKSQLTLRKKTA
ncbi:MAG TPA: sigma-70 family RNA polymerase sigma factor [Bacteroidia bacterium]|jgi:RNA polymerase sigma-70 factor (ECF subfamily)|nr:sigma-70 family RNA polymerase sigma factor [Bacteroidia bacterium]